MNEQEMNKWQCRSDLALEAVEQMVGQVEDQPQEGVTYEENQIKGLKVTCIDVDKDAVERVGKKEGRYMTVDTASVVSHDHDQLTVAAEVFADQFAKLLKHRNIKDTDTCLVIGLGNDHVTPDALGPLVVDEVIVTRHL
ncbi:MAG: GPR endopeptidase, partial [Turicibacter sp.]|nr:GPR endopeptidase [Turicibacter sp.]